MAPNETEIQRQKEIQQAEELLFSGRQELGFAKGLFLGNFVADWAMPYPRLSAAQQAELDRAIAEVRKFLDEHLDPEAIDRQADIPRHVIDGLGRVGVLGMTAPKEVGGRGFSQMQYCKVLEEIGARCASTSVFTNAHHSIGIRALLLFGTREQKEKWLPRARERRAARGFRSDRAGSRLGRGQCADAGAAERRRLAFHLQWRKALHHQRRDRASPDSHGAHAGSGEEGKDAITAFLVTPDMPGFEMIEPRMPKLGIRGTATGRFR